MQDRVQSVQYRSVYDERQKRLRDYSHLNGALNAPNS